MENQEENLNTESNDIAGNRIGGPVGNTATQRTAPNTGTGIPGGAPAPNPSQPTEPESSESLAASETSPGKGAVDNDTPPQENKEADPADLTPGATYGGNFGNSTQGSYRDEDRRENQDSDPNRGEFGAQNPTGTTHGGFGNQNRVVDYEPNHTAEDQYYGGAGRPGVQDNAYRSYDGRDERADPRTDYGFERGSAPAPNASGAGEGGTAQRGSLGSPAGDNRNQPDRADAASAHQVDNGSAKGPDSGYAADYGRTSLGNPGATSTAAPAPEHRNQTEDYLPTPSGTDNQGRPTAAPAASDPRSQQPASSEGYGDRGRQQPQNAPDYQTGGERNGYVQANNGNSQQGVGSRGGSYNDQYDDSKPNSSAGTPADGSQRSEDRRQNYGEAAREENRSSSDENNADHGAPRRNAGRDGAADE